MNPFKVLQGRRRTAARRKRVRQLERDPKIQAAVAKPSMPNAVEKAYGSTT
jgi:hypothetical protein